MKGVTHRDATLYNSQIQPAAAVPRMTDPHGICVGMKNLLRNPYLWVLVVFVMVQAALLLLAGVGMATDCGELVRQLD